MGHCSVFVLDDSHSLIQNTAHMAVKLADAIGIAISPAPHFPHNIYMESYTVIADQMQFREAMDNLCPHASKDPPSFLSDRLPRIVLGAEITLLCNHKASFLIKCKGAIVNKSSITVYYEPK